jgi:hypothetical protein
MLYHDDLDDTFDEFYDSALSNVISVGYFISITIEELDLWYRAVDDKNKSVKQLRRHIRRGDFRRPCGILSGRDIASFTRREHKQFRRARATRDRVYKQLVDLLLPILWHIREKNEFGRRMGKPRTPNLPWSDSMVACLLGLVIYHSAHLAHKGNATERWGAVNTSFFAQPENMHFMATHYDAAGASARKLRTQCNKVVLSIEEDVMRGNQSGKTGDRSRVYKHVKQILDDRQVISDATDQAALLKKCVGDAEENLLPGTEASSHSSAVDSKPVNGKPPAGWGPRKMTDGSISGGSDGNSLRSNKTGPPPTTLVGAQLQSMNAVTRFVVMHPILRPIAAAESSKKPFSNYQCRLFCTRFLKLL